MKKAFFFSLLFFSSILNAQIDDLTGIRSTIDNLFDGMRAGDSSMVRSAFDLSARLQTTFTNRDGEPVLKTDEIDGFVTAVGTPHDEIWDEKIWTLETKIDGNLATAWTEYTFYAGEKMSHCGVNAFHLFKSNDGWKITQITDTRRRNNCQTEPQNDELLINNLINAWHNAAAVADEDTFFGIMAPNAIYLGTDASEKWQRDELREWSAKYFEKESAWDFKPKDREVYFSKDRQTAWFDELLDTWMGTCRGSGTLSKTDGEWKLTHYNLAVTVPNDKINGFIELINNEK